jgi:hypothetical protein
MTALLAGAPLLVRSAVAQRPASIQATAYVTTSILAVALRPASAPVAAHATLPPATERVLIAGVGTLDVQTGPGEAIRVARVEDPRNQPTVIVQIFNVGS